MKKPVLTLAEIEAKYRPRHAVEIGVSFEGKVHGDEYRAPRRPEETRADVPRIWSARLACYVLDYYALGRDARHDDVCPFTNQRDAAEWRRGKRDRAEHHKRAPQSNCVRNVATTTFRIKPI